MPVSLLYVTTNNYSNFSKGLARVILLGEGKGSTVWLKYFAQQNSKITQLGLKCEEVFKFRVRISTAWLFHVSFVFLLYNFFMPSNLNPVYLSEHILCTCTLMILNFEDPEWNVKPIFTVSWLSANWLPSWKLWSFLGPDFWNMSQEFT